MNQNIIYQTIRAADGQEYKFPVQSPLEAGELVDQVRAKVAPHSGEDPNTFLADLDIHQRLLELIDPQPGAFLLDWPHRYSRQPVGRFSYHPETSEMILQPFNINHANYIRSFGKRKFIEYVRGIHDQQRRLLFLRAYYNPEAHGEYDAQVDMQQAIATITMLVRHRLPEDLKVIIGVTNNQVLKNYGVEVI